MDWAFKIYSNLIKLCWANGFQGTQLRGRFFGEGWWTINMVACAGNGVLTTFGVNLWKHIRKGWEAFKWFINFKDGMAL